jgi:transposase
VFKTTAKAVPVTIGLDIAKSFFQVHGIDAAGQDVLRRKLGRQEFVPIAAEPPIVVPARSAAPPI